MKRGTGFQDDVRCIGKCREYIWPRSRYNSSCTTVALHTKALSIRAGDSVNNAARRNGLAKVRVLAAAQQASQALTMDRKRLAQAAELAHARAGPLESQRHDGSQQKFKFEAGPCV